MAHGSWCRVWIDTRCIGVTLKGSSIVLGCNSITVCAKGVSIGVF